MVSKHNIINGIVKFIENDMSKVSGAMSSKIIVLFIKNIIKKNENILDAFFDSQFSKFLIIEKDGKYDISPLIDTVKETINEVGSVSINIPKIPLILPNGDELKFRIDDINNIYNYILSDSEKKEENINE